MLYRANFTNHAAGIVESNRWYPTARQAQDALMRHRNVGPFVYLGDVRGDCWDGPECLYAPRNGGAVDIDLRDYQIDE